MLALAQSTLVLAAGGATCLIVGILIGYLLGQRRSTRHRQSTHSSATSGDQTLALVPRSRASTASDALQLDALIEPTGPAGEAYQEARLPLLRLLADHGSQAILVTSAEPGNRGAVTLANLGVVLARSGKRIIAVSSDLRDPLLPSMFGISGDRGLAEVLRGERDVPDALVRTQVRGLALMLPGDAQNEASTLLASAAFTALLVQLRKVADIVLLDSPPLAHLPDALEIAPKADGVIVVADELTPPEAMGTLFRRIERAGGSVVGVILDEAASTPTDEVLAESLESTIPGSLPEPPPSHSNMASSVSPPAESLPEPPAEDPSSTEVGQVQAEREGGKTTTPPARGGLRWPKRRERPRPTSPPSGGMWR